MSICPVSLGPTARSSMQALNSSRWKGLVLAKALHALCTASCIICWSRTPSRCGSARSAVLWRTIRRVSTESGSTLELVELPVARLADLIATRELSSREVVVCCLGTHCRGQSDLDRCRAATCRSRIGRSRSLRSPDGRRARTRSTAGDPLHDQGLDRCCWLAMHPQISRASRADTGSRCDRSARRGDLSAWPRGRVSDARGHVGRGSTKRRSDRGRSMRKDVVLAAAAIVERALGGWLSDEH